MKKIKFLLMVLFVVFLCSCGNSSAKKRQIMEEATERWQDFLDTDQLTISVIARISMEAEKSGMDMGFKSSRSQAKICKSPFYFETELNEQLIVIQEEQNELYQYTAPVAQDEVFVTRTQVGNMSFIDDITDDYYEEDLFSDFNMKFLKVKQEQDVYTFQMNLGYYLQAAGATDELEDIVSALDGDISIFFDSILTMTMSFTDTSANLKIEMELKNKGVIYLIKLETNFENQEFSKVDFSDHTKYFFRPPSNIIDITQFTSCDEPLLIPAESTNYFKYNLKKGQYGVYMWDFSSATGDLSWVSNSFNGLDVKVYNKKFEEVPMGIGLDSDDISHIRNTFYISEPGIYYLCIDSSLYHSEKIRLSQENYNTIGYEKTTEFVSSKGEIEGEFDFDVYTFDGNKNEIIKIKNTGSNPLPILHCDYKNSPATLDVLMEGKSLIIKPLDGENKFIICSDFEHYADPFEYEFEIEKIALENGYEENYEDMHKVTTDFSDLTYIVGYDLPNPRLVIEVEKKSIIEFEILSEDVPESCAIDGRILNLDGEEIEYSYYRIFELNPGKYILELNNFGGFIATFRIKYTATEF